MAKTPLSIEMLHRLLSYDPETGILTWRERDLSFFGTEKEMNTWNAKFAGKPALACPDKNGHLRGTILGGAYFAHRVAFALHHGHWPTKTIDHIEGIRTDNRHDKIRDASYIENSRNMRLPKHNVSGHMGVSWCKREKRWQAKITVARRVKWLGYFDVKSDAIAARKAAELAYGFHPNHGRAMTPCLPIGGRG